MRKYPSIILKTQMETTFIYLAKTRKAVQKWAIVFSEKLELSFDKNTNFTHPDPDSFSSLRFYPLSFSLCYSNDPSVPFFPYTS